MWTFFGMCREGDNSRPFATVASKQTHTSGDEANKQCRRYLKLCDARTGSTEPHI